MFRKVIILFVILCSLSLFNLIFIPPRIIKVLEFFVPLFMLFLLIFYKVYDKSYRFKSKFSIEVSLIFVAVILSMFGAYYFHKQGFFITILAQRFIYFLLFYPLLHILKPKPEELIKILVAIGIIYAGLYVSQTLIYPRKLADVIMFSDRKTLRIALPGSGYLFLGYLIGLSRFIKTNNLKYLLLCMVAIIVFSLTGTRQILAPLAIITILSILFSKKIKSRVLIITLIMLAILPAYYLFRDTFSELFALSHQQSTNLNENMRIKAAVFFLFEFFPNKLAYIIGNGVPSGNSPYGVQINEFKELFGYYQSDIGIIGDYTKFGILLVIAQISIYIRIMIMRLPEELDFVKYNILASIFAIFFGSAFSYAENIVVLCILFYLVDISSFYKPVNADIQDDIGKDEKQIPFP